MDSSAAGPDGSSASGSISCGSAMCTQPGQVCCVTFNGQGGGGAQDEACSASATDCTSMMGTALECTSSSQCPQGQVCCGINDNGYTTVSCQAITCSGNLMGGGHYVQFCDPNVPNDCPSSAPSCQMSTRLSAVYVCQ